ncbi:FAD-binding protein [Pendulispora brunnea]|uniref:FAD-binding protein n=1 Tax=Pendulispora brunnea TaxID=2905690 RepID=A0ABZ2KNP4_9BACT
MGDDIRNVHSRRAWMQGFSAVVAGTVVGAFDVRTRQWISVAEAAGKSCPSRDAIPPLEGQLTMDSAALTAAADDWGNVIHRQPWAVLKPASVADIQKMVKFCRCNGIKVAVRGVGHSVYGQDQAEGGLVIDSQSLTAISVSDGYVDVQPGATFGAVHAAAPGRTLLVWPEHTGLTICGALSVGGLGITSFSNGSVADTILELDVVLTDGSVQTCSARRRPALFHSVRAGLGQFGIIVRARLPLAPAPTNATMFILAYDNIDAYMADYELLSVRDRRFQALFGGARPAAAPQTGFVFTIEATAFFTGNPPDQAALLAGLHYVGQPQVVSAPYTDFQNRNQPNFANLKALDRPAPFLAFSLPKSASRQAISDLLATPAHHEGAFPTAPNGAVVSFFRIWCMKRSQFKAPLLRFASGGDDDVIWMVIMLKTLLNEPSRAPAVLEANRQLYDRIVPLGGKQYPINAIPNYSPADWRKHFDLLWPVVSLAKFVYDRENVLTPGQGMFTSECIPCGIFADDQDEARLRTEAAAESTLESRYGALLGEEAPSVEGDSSREDSGCSASPRGTSSFAALILGALGLGAAMLRRRGAQPIPELEMDAPSHEARKRTTPDR